jgi:elongator complex protein 3
VSFTEVKKWLENGKWKPYSERDIGLLEDVLVHRQKITRKMVRVNRTQRDFPNAKESNDYLGYTSQNIPSDLGDKIHKKAIKMGIYCQCIRCREIKDESFDPGEIKYYTLEFMASGCKEYFISAEIPRHNSNLLLGFIRLRILNKDKQSLITELQSCDAMIRELHVYGRVTNVGEKGEGAQHLGIGTKLLSKAEWIAKTHFRTKMAIISGIGVREYYAKRGYTLDGTYMVKQLYSFSDFMSMIFIASILLYLCLFNNQLCCLFLRN